VGELTVQQRLSPLEEENNDRLGWRMENVAIKMSAEELRALLEMVDNQLFRMKYIDSKIPGHQKNPEELKLAAGAVGILREAFNRARGIKTRAAAETKP
jgi:hypothetical protein